MQTTGLFIRGPTLLVDRVLIRRGSRLSNWLCKPVVSNSHPGLHDFSTTGDEFDATNNAILEKEKSFGRVDVAKEGERE